MSGSGDGREMGGRAVEPDRLWGRVAIQEPGGGTVEVDTPSGWTLTDWQAYAERYHGPGCAVTAIAGLPTPTRAPADPAVSCDGAAGITSEVFRSLLTHRGRGGHTGGRHPPHVETEDLKEFFEERAAILEHDGGPKPELEAPRITAAYVKNRERTWASLGAALAD